MNNFLDLGLKTKELRIAFPLVFLVRMLVGLIMFVDPLFGWILSQLFDYLDAVVLDQIYGIGRVGYTKVDKIMDLGVDLIMLAVSVKYGSFVPLLFLLIFRTVGQIVYWKTEKQWTLILFPNFFDSYWFWTVVLIPFNLPHSVIFLKSLWGLVILMSLKAIHEFFNHYFYPKYIYPLSMQYVWAPLKKKVHLS